MRGVKVAERAIGTTPPPPVYRRLSPEGNFAKPVPARREVAKCRDAGQAAQLGAASAARKPGNGALSRPFGQHVLDHALQVRVIPREHFVVLRRLPVGN